MVLEERLVGLLYLETLAGELKASMQTLNALVVPHYEFEKALTGLDPLAGRLSMSLTNSHKCSAS